MFSFRAFTKAVYIVGVTVVPLLYSSCSQPYDLQVKSPSNSGSSTNSLKVEGSSITNNPMVSIRLDYPYAKEMYLTATLDCAPGGTWTPFEKHYVYTVGPSDGVYPISVKFRNTRKVESACISTTVTYDVTAPNILFPMTPNSLTSVRMPQFEIEASDGLSGIDRIECQLNGTPLADCENIRTMSLADGNYRFEAVAIDVAGNRSVIKAHNWTVDSQAPTITLSGVPAAFTPGKSATLTFSAIDNGVPLTAFTCQFDGAAAQPCTSPLSYSNLAEGSHTFVLTVTDGAGNQVSKTATWVVDSVAPTLAFTGGPDAVIRSTSTSYSWSASDPGTVASGINRVECQLDSANFVPCTSPRALSGLSEGLHTFKVRVIDRAANLTQISGSFTVDTVAPTLSFTSTPAALGSVANVSFAWNASDATTGISRTDCRLDSGAYATCTSPHAFTASQGSHTFTVTVRDNAGNSSTISYNFAVDNVAPVVTLTTFPSTTAWLTVRAASFRYTITDTSSITKIECQIDNFTPFTCPKSGSDLTGISEGAHTFKVSATDATGLTGSDSTPFKIDSRAPSAPVITLSNATGGTAALLQSSTDTTSGIQNYMCQLLTVDAAVKSAGASATYTGLVAGRSYNYTCYAVDNAGLKSTTTTFTFVAK